MKYIVYIFLFFWVTSAAQQTGQYTQFTFNSFGYNPAAAGTNINGNLEAIVGIRKQWIGFDYAPASNFVSANYTFKPQRSYKRWHNAGIYISQEKMGIFKTENIYGSYTLHLPITNRYFMSFGIFAGVRKFGISRSAISQDDPVYGLSSANYFYAYPDFVPGIRLYSRKMFFDVSVQQVFKVRQVQGDKQIGNKSLLTPQIYLSYGKKIALDNGLIVVPTINVHSSFTNIPSVEVNVMAYYRKRVGVGATIRNKDFISGIVQIRFWQNVTAGFAYDYSINRIHSAATNSLEFMVGVTPLFKSMGSDKGRHNVAKCPDFDF